MSSKEERTKILVGKYSAVLQYGSDIALAVAMGSFSTFLWVAPSTEGIDAFWKIAGTAAAGGAGIWGTLAHERFTFAWKQVAGANRGWIAAVVSVLAMAIGMSAVFAVVRFAEHQRIASACERAESAKNEAIVRHELCRSYFARRALLDAQLFKSHP
ncbi:hypothetical protein C7E17_00215 [Stenotrophomonas maltophilia]|uniref:hypothetical protein n=1 Tax=Stenotrophomonas maltophilia TaxID=40324 RepID=UPI000D47790F|nr:hypothetical protein [Stenotrophomonas maltophilia]MDT3448877.1 hypothetical protein [Stenotrophomonas maltophilia]PSD33797.1 hypothetical protein C7E17_00215 [Stenotrophomonas maltophilia]